MSPPRFLVDCLPETGPLQDPTGDTGREVELEANESRHASTVLRLGVGAAVVLFDGKGGEAQGVIVRASKKTVVVRYETRSDTNRELPFEMTMCIALPKGDRQKSLVDSLTQLGVTRLVPLITKRGVAQPTGNAMERIQRAVIEASKQCGRNRLMQVGAPVTIDDFACGKIGGGDPVARFFAHPYGEPVPIAEARFAIPGEVQVAIGPEGGFSEEEVAELRRHGCSQVSLGKRILRIEMAAVAAAAWLAMGFEGDRQ